MQLIGILRWAVEIGWIDIYLKVSLLSQYQANPRLRYPAAIYQHIFAYLKKHPDMGWLAYDPKCPNIDERIFHHNADWKEFYGKVDEELPPNMPKLRGRLVTISSLLTLTTQATSLRDVCTAAYFCLYRMHP
jgi:hypothetical protein